MSSKVPQKIILDKSTKVSLNDRFTKFTKERLQNRKQTVKVGPTKIFGNASTKTALRQQKAASTKNRRLAQQMANRPSVQAALRLKKRSIKQRIGGAGGVGIGPRVRFGLAKTKRLGRGATIKARLNRSASQTPNIKSRLSGIKRANKGINPATVINRTTNAGHRLNKNIQRRNALNASGKFGHLKSSLKTHFGGQSRVQSGNFQQKVSRFNQSGRLSGRIKAKQQRIRGRLTRGGRRNRGQPQQQHQQKTVATKESLDKDLDQYMLKTKSRLDNDLDAYMAQTN